MQAVTRSLGDTVPASTSAPFTAGTHCLNRAKLVKAYDCDETDDARSGCFIVIAWIILPIAVEVADDRLAFIS